jgi:hypothetical protein
VSVEIQIGEHCAIIDDADLPIIQVHRWHISSKDGHAYAGTWIRNAHVRMHRLIIGATKGAVVDHINGNTLDNRRSNLRVCTHRQNLANSGARTGRFKGVSHTRHGGWRATIHIGKKQTHLGIFETEEAAARAYDAAAIRLHGEFARLNFPQSVSAWPAPAMQLVGEALPLPRPLSPPGNS